MSQLAQLSHDGSDGLSIARVFKVEAANVWVRLSTGTVVVAQTAASCLLQAASGDQVLLASLGEDYWLLAILQRLSNQPAQLQVSGDLAIHSGGQLTLNSEQDLLIRSAGRQQIVAETWQLDSQQLAIHCQKVNLIARVFQLTTGTFRQWAEQLEQVANQVLQKFGQRLCMVKQHDEQRSDTHRHLVQGTAQLQAETIVQKAKGSVNIDGQQIHLG